MGGVTPLLVAMACVMHDGVRCDNGLDVNGDGWCDRDAADWGEDASLEPGVDRHNIYDLEEEALAEVTAAGLGHATSWPVGVSGLLLPEPSFRRLFEEGTTDPDREQFQSLARNALGFGTMEEMAEWLGLARYPADGSIPIPSGREAGDPMGMGTTQTEWGPAFSVSCFACHASELFGRPVVGLTNRRSRANEYFESTSLFFPIFPAAMYQDLTGASDTEMELYVRAQANLPAVGAQVPVVHGVDTSLAQVGLSLARRQPDAWATRDATLEQHPRESLLDGFVADSKPAVWWTLRYKTHWLSDGSVRSGNPVFTNFLWNEIGRGTDLRELDAWMATNGQAMDELTVAVFNTPSPRWEVFLPEVEIDEEAARRGEVTFEATCSACHGHYEKAWSEGATGVAGLQTTRVEVSAQSEVVDFGTDPQRAAGMADFAAALNTLTLSQRMGTIVEVQTGYVPPALDGIWARFPYLHNGSVPTLCDLLLAPDERPTTFVVGPPDNAETDFDAACVGLPASPPAAWLEDEANVVDTTVPGLSNAGHDVGVPEADRADLVEFLKTL
jgi:mono/diheme cytochrome c family protein